MRGEEMTDEERQKLLDKLYKFYRDSWYGGAGPACKEAADEIERLVKAVKYWKSTAEYTNQLLDAEQLVNNSAHIKNRDDIVWNRYDD